MGKLLESKHANLQHRFLKTKRKPLKSRRANHPPIFNPSKSSRRSPGELKQSSDSLEYPEQRPSDYETPDASPDESEVLVDEQNLLRLAPKDDSLEDLFYDDELKRSHANFIRKDFYYAVVEEIGLEGLDGVTLEAFFKRLDASVGPLTFASGDVEEVIWRLICRNPSFQFYELPEPRDELDVYLYHADTIGSESKINVPEIYPGKVVNRPGVQGSCATFETRIDVSKEVRDLSLDEARSKYGQRLVVVADQKLRRSLLMDDADPLFEMQNMEYCVLERIGRGRRLGDQSQGKHSISSAFQMDHKTIFHYQKNLFENRLLTKQLVHIRCLMTEQNKNGRLTHLRRFYKKHKSKHLLITNRIVNLLKTRPDNRMPLDQIKQHFPADQPFSKLCKMIEFRKIIRTDVMCPYRAIYPEAPESQYLRRSDKAEKAIRCFELIRPYTNVLAVWNCDLEESDDEEEEEDTSVSGSKTYNLELFREVYTYILSKGSAGCLQSEIRQTVGVDMNSIRMAIKKLVAKNVIQIKLINCGRQRKMVYYAKCLDNPNIESIMSSFNVKPEHKVSKLKLALIDRQRAAVEKMSKVTTESPGKKNGDLSLLSKTLKLRRNLPEAQDCPYLVSKLTSVELKLFNPDADLMKSLLINLGLVLTKHLPISFRDLQYSNLDQISITFPETPPELKTPADFNECYTSTYKIDRTMKLVLLKLTSGDLSLKDFRNYFTSTKNPKQRDSQSTSFKSSSDDIERRPLLKGLQFMGEHPVILFKNKEKNCNLTLTVSTPPSQVNFDTVYPAKKDVPERTNQRLQTLLDIINEKRIFEDMSKLLKAVLEREQRDGYDKRIDRKSLMRLLTKLVDEGFIKIFKLALSNETVTKTVYFFCHPTASHDDSMIENVCQQLIWKYFDAETSSQNVKSENDSQTVTQLSPFQEYDVLVSTQELQEMDKLDSTDAVYNKSRARAYGLQPKFNRMRIFHEFLFYLIYEYNASPAPLEREEVKELFRSYMINLTDDDLAHIPDIFVNEISWKMFIPALPQHKGWSTGWAFLCDVILRLPISVLCKIHACTFKLPEFKSILNHPIKRFYLLKDLPVNVRNAVLFKRKYIFNIHSTLKTLAFCGLVQFGPQKYKEKDQAFIYLNRVATLLDTTTSAPGYNLVEDKPYTELKYYLNTRNDLDNYWYNVYAISLNTKLNERIVGQLVTYVDISARPDLTAALKPKTVEEALECDNGKIYGDHRGAAGLDSSLWAHLCRNWYILKASRKPPGAKPVPGLMEEKMSNTQLQEGTSFSELHINADKVYLHKKSSVSKSHQKYRSVPTRPSKGFQKLERRLKARKKTKREYQDNIDKLIIKKIGKMNRSKWSKNEDENLMLCKVVEMLLTAKEFKKHHIYFTTIRDVLHRMCPESKNKTSKACHRRINGLMAEYLHYEKNVYNLLKIDKLSEYLSPLLNSMLTDKTFKINDQQLNIVYITVMSYVNQHKEEVSGVLLGECIDYFSDDNLSYVESNLVDFHSTPSKFSDATDEDDVKKDLIKSLIHSSLASKNQPDWALHFFKIYRKYSDQLICKAILELKTSQIIAARKLAQRLEKEYWQIPFRLSQTYVLHQYATFHVTTYVKAYDTFLTMNDSGENLVFSQESTDLNKYGRMMAINEFYTFFKRLRFKFDMPQHSVILNPSVIDHTNLIDELALRLQLRLKHMYESNTETEQDQDQDSEPVIQDDKDVVMNPLDSTVAGESTETIDLLKNWVSDCMVKKERSPSPEFLRDQIDESDGQEGGNSETSSKRVPSLDEIKEKMLQVNTTNEERTIPYITELADLLDRNNCVELNTDEKTLEQLRTHFVMQYPTPEEVSVEELDELKGHYIGEFLAERVRSSEIWRKIDKDIKCSPAFIDIPSVIRESEGEDDDVLLAEEIVTFINASGVLGTTGDELKRNFMDRQTKLPLSHMVKILTETGVVFRMGICKLVYIHQEFISTWSVETSETILTKEELEEFKETKKDPQWENVVKMRVTPWTKINGQLNKEVLQMWLCNVLSHCVDFPQITFPKLCERFCFIRPVDIFYLLEVLESLGCLDLTCYEDVRVTLFSEWTAPRKVHATILDDLDSIVVEPSNVAMMCLGSFFYEE